MAAGSGNFFTNYNTVTEEENNPSSFTRENSKKDTTVPQKNLVRRIQMDSSTEDEVEKEPLYKVSTISDSGVHLDSERVVPSSNTLMMNSEDPGPFGNFFAKPDIKLKMKLADGIPTLTDFMDNVAKPMASEWKEFGLALGIDLSSMETIERKNSTRDPSDSQFFAEVFNEWEKNKGRYKPLNWMTIVALLRKDLKKQSLADEIERKFLIEDKGSSDPSREAWHPQVAEELRFSSLPSSLNPPPSISSKAVDPQQDPGVKLPFYHHPSATDNVLISPQVQYQTEDNNEEFTSLPSSINFHSVRHPIDPRFPVNSPSFSVHGPLTNIGDPRMIVPVQHQIGRSPVPYEPEHDQMVQIPRGLPHIYTPQMIDGMGSVDSSRSSIPEFHYSAATGHPFHQSNPLVNDHNSYPGIYHAPAAMGMYVHSQAQPSYPQPHFQFPQGGMMQKQVDMNQLNVPPSSLSSSSSNPSSPKPPLNVPSTSQEHSSESSYHSASETIKKFDEASFTELVQKYMKELDSQRPNERPRNNLASMKMSLHKSNEESESIMRKELDKAYERISSLEVRIQDLTMQIHAEIPEDHEVAYLQKDKLEQEFRRMKELKKQSEKQTMEAKQTTQRLVAENSRLKEELSLVKNDREMVVNQLRREIKRGNERRTHSGEETRITNQELKEKIANRYKMLESVRSSRKEHLLTVTDLPEMTVTPELFWKILKTEKGKLSLGLVVIAGLPSCGKTSILNSLLRKENQGKPFMPRGDATSMQVHELLITKNPLTEEIKLTSAPGLESALYFLSVVVAQHCFRKKCLPSFPSSENLEREARILLSTQDRELQQHFVRVYKGVKSLIEEKTKRSELSELALFQPEFVNVWDVGVNRSLYQFLGCTASHCDRLVMVVFIDLERDVPRLNDPPDMPSKGYFTRGDDKLVMRIHSRLRYLLLMAGLKRWFNPDRSSPVAPEALIVGTYTKEFGSLSGGKKLKEAVEFLQRSVLVEADKMGISGVIDPNVLPFCSDANIYDDELNKLKVAIQELVSSQENYNTSLEANGMFLRSILYGQEKGLFASYNSVSKLALNCGIFFENDLDQFLLNLRNTGSLVIFPRSVNGFLHENIITDVVKPLKLLDKLHYLKVYRDLEKIGPIEKKDVELYQFGFISRKLASQLLQDESTETFLQYLSNCEICVSVAFSGDPDIYFFPSIRLKADKSPPHRESLFIKYESTFLHSACFTLFVKYLKKYFEVPSEARLAHTEEYNTLLFKYYETPSSSATDVKIILHEKKHVIEVRIDELKKDVKLDLCSKFARLSSTVFEHVHKNLQPLKYQLSIMCPEEESHFVPFFLAYHGTPYCKQCNQSVNIKDNRSCWLC